MHNRILVRKIGVTDATLTAAVKNQWAPHESVVVTECNHLESTPSHYKDRIESIAQGFELLVRSLPDGKKKKNQLSPELREKLCQHSGKLKKDYIDQINASGKEEDIAAHQKTLKTFTSHLILLLQKNAGLNKKQAIKFLNKAESYAGIQVPRPVLMTVSQMNLNGETYTVVQQETALPPLSKDLKQDYFKIRNNAEDMPDWFRSLDIREQAMLRYVLEKGISKEIVRELNRATENLEALKLAHLSIETIKNEPINPKNEDKKSNGHSTPLENLKKNADAVFKNAKEKRDDAEKAFEIALSNVVNSIPSKLRTLLGLPNFSKHQFQMYDSKGILVVQSERFRSAMIASRDVLGESEKVRDLHVQHNLEHMVNIGLSSMWDGFVARFEPPVQAPPLSLKEVARPGAQKAIEYPILVQTLITPIVGKQPDGSIYADKERTVGLFKSMAPCRIIAANGQHYYDVKHKYFSTNHPVNLGRFLSPTTYNGKNGKEGQGLIAFAKAFLGNKDYFPDNSENKQEEKRNLQNVVGAYESLLKKKVGLIERVIGLFALIRGKPASDRNRELALASYETMIIEMMHGVSQSSCVSGKDREAIKEIDVDAKFTFLKKYGKVPQDDDGPEERAKFVEIFAELYVTRHQQMYAGLNAPGSNGIKTPKLYLPKDICEAILAKAQVLGMDQTNNKKAKTQNTFWKDETLANNNEIKTLIIKPKKRKKLQKDFSNFTPGNADVSTVSDEANVLSGIDTKKMHDLLGTDFSSFSNTKKTDQVRSVENNSNVVNTNLEVNTAREMLVEKYDLPNLAQDSLETGLRDAVQKGDVEDVKQFLEHVKNINAQDQVSGSHKTALHWAVILKKNDIEGILRAKGARDDIPDAKGKTAANYKKKLESKEKLASEKRSEEEVQQSSSPTPGSRSP
ncbi:MAG: hypothetical protein JSS53_06135 [Proteobacteria bacterium]|nr:hypothetical protein [Pseudomonadota bacterium]